MSDYEFVSFDGLAGGGELGMIQAGMELKHRAGDLDLGWVVPETNRQIFGWNWDSLFIKGGEYSSRDVKSARVLYGNCPCSAWSTLTRKDLRGSDAKVLVSTNAFFDYAGKMDPPPEIISLESVQQAFSSGREYYQLQRDLLEERTGYKYDLVWLMQSNASLGGSSVRKRVFITMSRIPFGVEYAQPARVARFGDCVRDLEGMELTSSKQPYRRPPTWWSAPRRSTDNVDGHFNDPSENKKFEELMNMAADMGQPWQIGESMDKICERVYKHYDELPDGWSVDYLKRKNFSLGLNQTTMWDPNGMGKVVTGSGYALSAHYKEHRLLTIRETFRLQGWPDTVNLWPSRDYKKLVACPGKGVPVDAGRWLGDWVIKVLDGEPGTVYGELIGENERMVNFTNSYKYTLNRERPWDHASNVRHEQVMEDYYDDDVAV